MSWLSKDKRKKEIEIDGKLFISSTAIHVKSRR